jgi:hypothetical protein
VPNDLERLITELEAVTARMLAATCWDENSGFGRLSASRHRLAAQLMNRPDLDASATQRIQAVIEAGNGLVARIMGMRESVLAEIAQAETQQRFTRGIAFTVPRQAPLHHVDVKV